MSDGAIGVLVGTFLGWLLATIQYHRKTPGERALDRKMEESRKRLFAALRAAEKQEAGGE